RSPPLHPPAKTFSQLLEKTSLPLQDLLLGNLDREPACPIHFREVLDTTRLRRPLQGEGIALQQAWIEISPDRPGVDDLPARLLEWSESQHLPLQSGACLL